MLRMPVVDNEVPGNASSTACRAIDEECPLLEPKLVFRQRIMNDEYGDYGRRRSVISTREIVITSRALREKRSQLS